MVSQATPFALRVWLAGLGTAASVIATQPSTCAAVTGVAILCLAGANTEG